MRMVWTTEICNNIVETNKTLLWLTAARCQYLIRYTTTGRILHNLLKIFTFGWFLIVDDMNMQGSIGDQFILSCFWGEKPLPHKFTFTFLPCQPLPSRNHRHAMCLPRTICCNIRMCFSTGYRYFNIMKRKHSFGLYSQLYGERNITVCIMTYSSFGNS
jgi:hypothetical protein